MWQKYRRLARDSAALLIHRRLERSGPGDVRNLVAEILQKLRSPPAPNPETSDPAQAIPHDGSGTPHRRANPLCSRPISPQWRSPGSTATLHFRSNSGVLGPLACGELRSDDAGPFRTSAEARADGGVDAAS